MVVAGAGGRVKGRRARKWDECEPRGKVEHRGALLLLRTRVYRYVGVRACVYECLARGECACDGQGVFCVREDDDDDDDDDGVRVGECGLGVRVYTEMWCGCA